MTTTTHCTCGEAYGTRHPNAPKCDYCVRGTQEIDAITEQMVGPEPAPSAAEQFATQISECQTMPALVDLLAPYFEAFELSPEREKVVDTLRERLRRFESDTYQRAWNIGAGNARCDLVGELCPVPLDENDLAAVYDEVRDVLQTVLSDNEDEVLDALGDVTVPRTVNCIVHVQCDVDVPIGHDIEDHMDAVREAVENEVENGDAIVTDVGSVEAD